ncbi:hypothetical protein [Nitrosospira sp. Nsp2]|uniref:hypothetical protein n=1 Tax=Nitrosospira sp. Nsp2 TaxID=136548 RepID=UPI0011B1D0C9|nr:hypothetical protein [Nitrosospira sp. Nsp2]
MVGGCTAAANASSPTKERNGEKGIGRTRNSGKKLSALLSHGEQAGSRQTMSFGDVSIIKQQRWKEGEKPTMHTGAGLTKEQQSETESD